jgi:hypothetical protein
MTISNAVLFKQAHAMARATIQDGDCYRTTFGACLKVIKQDNTKQAGKKIVKQAIATALPFTMFFTIVCLFMALVFAATAEAEAIELPSQKGAIVYANKNGKKVAFEVTTVSANGFVAKDLYSRKITIFKLSDNKVTSSNGYNYDEQASKDWLNMYSSEQKRLNK